MCAVQNMENMVKKNYAAEEVFLKNFAPNSAVEEDILKKTRAGEDVLTTC